MVKHLIIEIMTVMAASLVISFVVHAVIDIVRTAFRRIIKAKDGEATI